MRFSSLIMLLLLLLPALASAQDVIYLKDGRTLDVHVKKISGSLIYYAAKPGAPVRYLSKNKVEKIVYERGREQVFKASGSRKSVSEANNLLTLAPAHIMVVGNQVGFGIGLDYERFIGSGHLISLHIPIYAGYTTDQTYAETDNTFVPYSDAGMVYTAPGIRLHWLKPESRADLATGISVVFGNVNYTSYTYNNNIGSSQQFLLTAVTLDNDITLVSKRKIAFGLHTAFGPVFGDYGTGGTWMVQIGLKVGRKF